MFRCWKSGCAGLGIDPAVLWGMDGAVNWNKWICTLAVALVSVVSAAEEAQEPEVAVEPADVAIRFLGLVRERKVNLEPDGDTALVANTVAEKRKEIARRLDGMAKDVDGGSLAAGEVKVDGHVVDKPAEKFGEDAVVEIKEKPRFVGRGGLKLEGALEHFGIDVAGWVCLDVGASTGGFTDCLLQRGAVKVHAVDVGTNQLVWKLRSDPRVVSREKFNARHMEVKDLGEKVRLAVMDLSFISLTKVLPAVFGVLAEGGEVVCLIKPQFELEREDVGKGGIVREEELRIRAVEKIRRFVTEDHGREWKGVIPASIAGTDGNQEFLAWIG